MNKNIFIIVGIVIVVVAGFLLFGGGSTEERTLGNEPLNTQTSEVSTVATSSQPVAETPTPTKPEGKEYTLAEVATHGNAASCYTVVRGDVYDVTAWIPKHPGGPQRILQMCGKDATTSFEGQHGGKDSPEAQLAGFKIDTLSQ